MSIHDEKPEDSATTLRWKIDKDIDLYKFYLDIAVKATIFLMTVTGAIASYVLANSRTPILGAALIFPAVMNAGFSMLFYFSISESRRLSDLHGKRARILTSQNSTWARSAQSANSSHCSVASLP